MYILPLSYTQTLPHSLYHCSALDKHTECLELWSTVIPTPTDLPTQLQLALALYRAGKYAESIQGIHCTIMCINSLGIGDVLHVSGTCTWWNHILYDKLLLFIDVAYFLILLFSMVPCSV